MDAARYLQLENRLFEVIGKEKVLEMKEDTISAVKKCNLDCAPGIMEDFFDYVRQAIRLSRT